MKKTLIGAFALGLASALAFTGPAQAANVVSYDLAGWVNESKSAGHVEITAAGLHVYTDDASGNAKAALYKSAPDGASLANIGTPALNWTGSTPAPGLNLRIDIAGGTGHDGTLVGESVYGDNWWLTGSSSAEMKALAPHTGGGNGSEWFGTLAEWAANAKTVDGAWVTQFGFSLGSGVEGDGVIKSMTFGANKYTFVPPTPVTPKEPTFTTPDCEKLATPVKPTTSTGVDYTFGEVKDGKVTMTAKAQAGYKLPATLESWDKVEGGLTITLAVPVGGKCPTPPADGGDNGNESPTPTPTPTKSATVAPVTPSESESTPAQAGLPVTGPSGGTNVPLISGLAGGALLAFGIALYAWAKRRRDNDAVEFTA